MLRKHHITLGEFDEAYEVQTKYKNGMSIDELAEFYSRRRETLERWVRYTFPPDCICFLPTEDRAWIIKAISEFGKKQVETALGWSEERLNSLHAWYYRYRGKRNARWHLMVDSVLQELKFIRKEDLIAWVSARRPGADKTFAPNQPIRAPFKVTTVAPYSLHSWALSTSALVDVLLKTQWTNNVFSVRQNGKWYHKQRLSFVMHKVEPIECPLDWANTIERTGKQYTHLSSYKYADILTKNLADTTKLCGVLHHEGRLYNIVVERPTLEDKVWRWSWSYDEVEWDPSVPNWVQGDYGVNAWVTNAMLDSITTVTVPWELYESEGLGAFEKFVGRLPNNVVAKGKDNQPKALPPPPPSRAKPTQPKAPPPPPPRTPSQIKGAYADKLRLANIQGDVIAWVLHPDVTVADVENYLREYFPNVL